jgi:hypothetical protein
MYSTVNSIFHISIRINYNRISEGLQYFYLMASVAKPKGVKWWDNGWLNGKDIRKWFDPVEVLYQNLPGGTMGNQENPQSG